MVIHVLYKKKTTMKKIYNSPKIFVVKVESNQMICESAVLDKSQSITNSEGFGSRGGGSFWDDDEDF